MEKILPDLWLALSVVGLVTSFMAMRQVALDYLSSRILTNGRRAVAVVGFVGESIRFVIYLFYGGIGIYYAAKDLEVERTGVGLVMLAALVLLLAKTALQLWLNRYLYKTSLAVQNEGGLTRDQIEDIHFGEQRRELEAAHIEEEEKNG